MNSTTYIPNRDGDFDMWAHKFLTHVEANPADYGLTTDDITQLQNTVTQWDANYSELQRKREAAKGATVGRTQSRNALEQLLRNFAGQIQADPDIPAEKKVDAGLSVQPTSRRPILDPTSAPIVSIEAHSTQHHSLRFTDSSRPDSSSRPQVAFGVVIFMFVGDTEPMDDRQFVLHSTVTRMRASIHFTGNIAGKTAWYCCRYINTRGVLGPWSSNYSSTIMA